MTTHAQRHWELCAQDSRAIVMQSECTVCRTVIVGRRISHHIQLSPEQQPVPPPSSPSSSGIASSLCAAQHFVYRGGRHGIHASSQQSDGRAATPEVATASVAVASDREDQPAGCCAEDQPQAAGSSSSRKRDAPGPSWSPEMRDPNGMPALCCDALCSAVM